ncbi:MAG: hypothetical protein JSS89_06190 [Bacteroidetes bacterium]|nr:hypothetical protein [Bacteroidota bacterium]
MYQRKTAWWGGPVALLCLVGLTACGPQFVTYNSIGFLQKGMDQKTVHDNMDVSSTSMITITEQGHTYVLEYYPLQTAQTKTTNTTYSYGSFGVPTTRTTTTTITDHTHTLIVMYQDRRLRYWGMMADYSKSEDPEILAIAPAVYQQFMNH